MRIRSFSYFADEAVRSTARNSLMSITSIITVSACVFMLVLLYCIAVNVDNALMQFENTTGVLTVIIEDSASTEDISALFEEISSIAHVDKVDYVPSEEATRRFVETLADEDKYFLEGLENMNVLRRRFTVTLESGKYDDLVIARLNQLKAENKTIASVNHFKDLIDKLVSVNSIIRIVFVFIILILFSLAVVIIINTIKLAVNSRRAEIGIMKYVGATDWFVKWPFILEGMFIGAMGAVIPLIVLVIGYDYAGGRISDSLSSIGINIEMLPGIAIFQILVPVSIVFGCIIGVVGSIMSVRRYLNA